MTKLITIVFKTNIINNYVIPRNLILADKFFFLHYDL